VRTLVGQSFDAERLEVVAHETDFDDHLKTRAFKKQPYDADRQRKKKSRVNCRSDGLNDPLRRKQAAVQCHFH